VLAAAVHRAASLVCHQRPDRSFRAGAVPLPVCARCTGLYLAAALGACAAWAGARRQAPRAAGLLALASLPTVLTLVLEWSGAAALSNGARSAAAVPLGAAAAWLVVRMLRAEDQANACAMIG
jgi:uncharacterized membrane protein